MTTTQTMSFQAEVSRLIDIVAHSLYSEREVFLRELIANAADACDKLRYLALTTPSLRGESAPFAVDVILNADQRQITVADNGIGMTQEEIQTALTPFGRVRNKLAFNEPGTGLGLPLACRLIETMNGQFELRSEPHKGTEVAIILPVA